MEVTMQKTFGILLMAAVLALPSGCATKGQTGAVIGGLGGAAVGGQLGPKSKRGQNALIGAAVGTLLGYIVGNELDKYDRQQISTALEHSPSGQPTSWVNPDTGRAYQVTPAPAYTAPNNDICRDFTLTGQDASGQPETIHTKACRNAYGQWELMN
ncbi:MAG: hypothetical protein PWQ64_1513 [Desulfomicrobiaceae bacterium]|jgi:surface antigen|nr:hypothetical protein [Desulfomicrobiaceae bacterium]